MRQRIIVCPLIQNEGSYLLCRMPKNRGVFPGQWALPGGGQDEGETIEQALRREIREELGPDLEVDRIVPWTFRDDVRVKSYADGSREEIYMIYLIFDCYVTNRAIQLNDEFEELAWIQPGQFADFDLNEATRITLQAKGLL